MESLIPGGRKDYLAPGGGSIGMEDVFKTLTTGKEGDKSLKRLIS